MSQAESSAPHDGEHRPRVVLVDPAFSSDRAGHHWRLNLGYAELFGLDRCWFATHRTLKRAVGIPADRIIRAFSVSPYEAEELRRLGRLGIAVQTLAYRDTVPVPRAVRSLLQNALKRRPRRGGPSPRTDTMASAAPIYRAELLTLIDNLALGPDDHLVFISLDARMGRTVVELAAERGLSVLPALHLRLMYDENTPSDGGLDYTGLIERIAALGDTGERLTLHCETAVHAAVLSEKLGSPVGVAPYPAAALPPPQGPLSGHFTVAFLGEARAERGFDLVLPVMEAFRRRHPELTDRTAWCIHAGGTTAETTAARDLLRKSGSLGALNAAMGPAAPADYEQMRASADIILAPQDPAVYALRGSGVAQEAAASGRPLVCLAGSSLEREPDAAVAAGHSVEDLADAIAEIVRAPTIWFERAREGASRFPSRLSECKLVRACAQPAVAQADRPIALIIGPWWPQGGSGRLMALQARTLQCLGYQVIRSHLARPGVSAAAVLARALKGPDRDLDTVISFATPAVGQAQSPWSEAPVDARISAICQSGRVRVLVVNFAQCAAWAAALPLNETVVRVLETHELALDAATGDSFLQPADPPAGFDAAVFVNAAEANHWRDRGQPRCTLIIPPLDDRMNAQPGPPPPVYDLLFVGSNHERNRIALQRLINRILNHSDLRDVSLAIAGDVKTSGGIRANTVELGRLADLDAAYDSARLIVVPWAPGGGLPSKVLGALCRGAPLVADSEAVSFLDDPSPFAARDDDEFRRRILEILADPAIAARSAEASRRAWSQLGGAARYRAEWRSLLGSLGALPGDASRPGANRV